FRGTTAAEFAAWLRQALARNLSNLLRHYYGTQARDPRLEQELADDPSSQTPGEVPAAPLSTPSRHATRREDAVRLTDALHQLPDDYRDVLMLRYLEGLTFPAVADRLGRSVDSVEKLWVRALVRLRHIMGAEV